MQLYMSTLPTDLSNLQTTQVENADNLKSSLSSVNTGTGPNEAITADIQLVDGKPSKADMLLIATGLDQGETGAFQRAKLYFSGLSKEAQIEYAQKTLFNLAMKIVRQRIFDVNQVVPSYVNALLDKIPNIAIETAGEYNNAVQLGTVRNVRYQIVPKDTDVHQGVIYEGVNVVSKQKECDIYVSEKLLINMFNSPESLTSTVNLIVGQLENSQKFYEYDFIAKTITNFNFQKQIDLSGLPVSTESDLRNFTYELFKAITPITWINNDWNLTSECKVFSGKSPEDLVIMMPAFFQQKIDIALLANLFNQGLVANSINAVLKPENIIILPNTRLANDQDNLEGDAVSVDNPIVVESNYLTDGTNPYIVLFSKNAFAYATQYKVRSTANWMNFGPGLYQHKINWAFDLWKYDFEKGAKIKLPASLL